MKRRDLLKSLGAIGSLPFLPSVPTLANAGSSLGITANTYKSAELIARAHSTCSLGMLKRLLKIDAASAELVKSQLIKNGVISAHANAYGLHTPLNPLYRGAFIKAPTKLLDAIETAKTRVNTTTDKSKNFSENDNEDNHLIEVDESNSEQVESISEDNMLTSEPEINGAQDHQAPHIS